MINYRRFLFATAALVAIPMSAQALVSRDYPKFYPPFESSGPKVPSGKGWGIPAPFGFIPQINPAVPQKGISYHNGPVMLGTTNVYYIWYGNWSARKAKVQPILEDFAKNIGGSPHFNINTTYVDGTNHRISNSVAFKKSVFVNTTTSTGNLTDTAVETIVKNAITNNPTALGGVNGDPNGVYFVLTALGIGQTDGTDSFCNSYCGWHSSGSGSPLATNIKYSFIGDTNNCSGCNEAGAYPNGDVGGDAMVSTIAHELEEAVTDPFIDAWYDVSGQENADKCAWVMGSRYSVNSSLGAAIANQRLGARNYFIQMNWVNNGSAGFCANEGFTVNAVNTNQNGSLHVFARNNTNNNLLHRTQTTAGSNSAWSTWGSLAMTSTSNPVVMKHPDGRLEVFVRDKNGVIEHRAQTAINSGTWGAWATIPGLVTEGDPAIGKNSDGRYIIFARNASKVPYYAYQTALNGSTWSTWTALPSQTLLSDMVVGTNQNGKLELFAKSSTGTVLRMQQSTAGIPTSWPTSWSTLGQPTVGGISSKIAVAQNGSGANIFLDVFVRGQDSAIWHSYQTASNSTTWSAWASLKGVSPNLNPIVVGNPTVARNPGGFLELYIESTDNAIYRRIQTAQGSLNSPAGTWGRWNSLGGVIVSDITVGQNGATGRPSVGLQLFGRGTGDTLYYLAQSSSGVFPGSVWTSLPGVIQ